MIRCVQLLLTLGIVFGMSSEAFAADALTIRSQLSGGEYSVAYEEAKALETAEGYGLAAEALLSEVILGRAEKNKKQSKRARAYAEAALELDPTNQNARLQYAIADGFITRETGDVSAWLKKLPQKTYDIIQAYRSDYPEDPRGDALLGAWHLAIIRKTGSKDGQSWFDANIEDGRALFLKSRAREPNDLVIGVSYAFALIALKDKDLDNTEEARAILEHIIGLNPTDYLTAEILGYAREALLRLDDRDAARDYVGLFLDGEVPM
ncbi:hypothetical protein GCM10011309_17880 [Litorimonas cladophorae]|uniref:Tetratricopeptide repeat protein n=1 Tax=Litorimonas cladophorae TaxID=1220491 RepID=A0A918KLK8_9PROT|nr:hypothetical protein [Litorimonas cladophorae]GGX68519.1 hypothetical protein GCM10011309_17880 [Litorimonas cladophorae]